MPLPVLEPVKRRRRRHGSRAAAAVVLALLLAGGAFAAWRHYSPLGAAGASAPRAAAAKASGDGGAATTWKRPAPLLVAAAPLSRHRFQPGLGARSAVLVDARTGRVIWARQPSARRPIASTTKIMTALLALERLVPSDVVIIPPAAPRVEPLREGLRRGERVPVWKLLHGLMLFSGNDDAIALAVRTSRSVPAFVGLMNETARRLGLRDTHFADPSGLADRRNYSTASDLAALARHALQNGRFRRIVRTRIMRVRWAAPTYAKVYVNKNHLLTTYRGADGVKTGWTTMARHCLVASAHRSGVRLVAVVLGSPDAFADARRLLDLGFRIEGVEA